MTILARISTFEDLRLALSARKNALGLRNLDVDEIAGLQGGYFGKLACGAKRPGDMSLPAVLGALGCELALVPCETSSHEGKSRDEKRVALKEKLRQRAVRAVRTRKMRSTAEDRAKWARKAAKVRWAKAGIKRRKRRRASPADPPPSAPPA